MHYEASFEKRTSRSKSRSPLRSSLKRSRSFSSYPSTSAPLGQAYPPAPWVHRATRITYPPHAYPSYPSATDSRVAVATYKPSYAVPGAYPTTPPHAHAHAHRFSEPKSEYTVSKSTYTYQRPEEPLENPEVKAAIEHEQKLRMLSEKSHQETLKQQMLGMEIERVQLQRLKAQSEEASRQRMQRLYLLSQQEQMAAQAHAYAHARHRAHSRHRSRSRHHRSRSRSSARSIEYDEHRRSMHTHCRCGHHRSHYSGECRTCSHGHLLLDGPRSSAPALLPAPSRGRRSRRGSVASSDEEDYAVYSDDEERAWYSDGNEALAVGRPVPADKGVLVMYGPGGGPASRRSSMRHVVA